MKIAHLILAHGNPGQLERLVKRLSGPRSDIYIHLDSKVGEASFRHISGIPGTVFVKNRVNVCWGEYSIIRATLNGCAEILQSRVHYSHINLLSGEDYPLQKIEDIEDFLLAHREISFVAYEKIFPDWCHGQRRIRHYYLGWFGFPGRYMVGRAMNRVLPGRRLPRSLIAYGRSQWMTLTPAAVRYVMDFIKTNPSVHYFFKMTWGVDEVFFQTILCNSPLADTLINDNLRHIEFNEHFRPVIFRIQDADALLSSEKLFARKFSQQSDGAILDYLDAVSSPAACRRAMLK